MWKGVSTFDLDCPLAWLWEFWILWYSWSPYSLLMYQSLLIQIKDEPIFRKTYGMLLLFLPPIINFISCYETVSYRWIGIKLLCCHNLFLFLLLWLFPFLIIWRIVSCDDADLILTILFDTFYKNCFSPRCGHRSSTRHLLRSEVILRFPVQKVYPSCERFLPNVL